MELAVQHGISGIDGDCGGVCSYATCPEHVDPTYFHQTGEAPYFSYFQYHTSVRGALVRVQ